MINLSKHQQASRNKVFRVVYMFKEIVLYQLELNRTKNELRVKLEKKSVYFLVITLLGVGELALK